MKTKNVLLILLISISACVSGQQNPVTTCNVLFEKNSDVLTVSYRSRLDSLAKTISYGEEIGITGYTDSDADERFNKSLSRRRAIAVKNYLRRKGLPNKMHLDFKGEEMSLNQNNNEIEKALNRRVEILYDYSKYNDVLNSFKKDYQVYSIDPNRDTLLICAGGLRLEFANRIMATTSSEPITIKVQEFYTKGDFILAGLNTQGSGNTLLESGGMMNIEAWQSGKKIEVKTGRQVGVIFKNRQPADSMQMFNGHGPAGSMSWLEAVSGTDVPKKVKQTTRSKEMMSVHYSTYDTSYVYSHHWEEGFLKITKSSIKGKVTVDTVQDENAEKAELLLGTTKLGWINCDRFIYVTAPKTVLAADFKSTMFPFVSIVFKDIHSIMASNAYADNRALFNGIPKGKAITIIGIFKEKNSDKVFLAMQDAVSGNDMNVKLKFEELNLEEVKERLKNL